MFKVAISGCGQITTKKYIPIFWRLRHRARIVGLCDLSEEALRRVSAQFGSPKAYKDFSHMLSDQKPDLVVICTPPKTHADLAVQAMQEGAHVLVEKPMATSVTDCERMNKAAVRHNRKLGIMHNQLFNPAFEKAKQIVSNEAIGRFLGMRIWLATSVDYMTSKQDHWAHKLPGGVLGETGPHAVYLSLAFLKNIEDVQVRYKKLLPEYPWSKKEDIRINLIADNGMSSITLTYGSVQTTAEVDIITTNALLKLDLQSRSLIEHKRPDLSARTIGSSVLRSVYQMTKSLAINSVQFAFSRNLDPHYRGIKNFLNYLSNGAYYPATGEEGKRVVAVEEMIIQRMPETISV